MKHLDSLNIRKGIELDIPITEIFKIETEITGDVLARDIYQIGVSKFFADNPEIDKSFLLEGGLFFTTKKKEHTISGSLKAYVFDSYLIDLEPFDDESSEIIASYFVEIQFLNTKILNFDEFCQNLMMAQRFSGQFNDSIFKHDFFGYGTFTMDEFHSIQKLANATCIHMVNFFIKHKNILSGISSFMMGLYRNDIMKQREYFTPAEFTALLDEAEGHFNVMASQII